VSIIHTKVTLYMQCSNCII